MSRAEETVVLRAKLRKAIAAHAFIRDCWAIQREQFEKMTAAMKAERTLCAACSKCRLCGGSGWKPVVDGSGVTRCDCRRAA